MSPLKVLLAFSLAFNAGLVTLLIFQAVQSGAPAPRAPSAAAEKAGAGAQGSDVGAATGEPLTDATGVAPRSLATAGGLRQLHDDLIAAGYSRERAEHVVLAVATGEWMTEMEALAGAPDEEFWQAPSLNRHLDLLAEMIQRRRKYEATAAAALGREDTELPSVFSMIGGAGPGGLPSGKRRDVMMIEEDYQLLRHQLQRHSVMLPEEVEALQMLEQEMRDDLLTVLTPEELREYELRRSSTSQQLRQRLSAFQPTAEEFREIFELNRALDLEYGSQFIWTPEEDRRQRQRAEEEMMDELREMLGEERFADYARSQDFEYNSLFNLAGRLDLSREAVDQIYEMSRLVRNQQQELRSDAGLSEEDRREAAEILYEEVHAALIEAMGEGGVEVYKRYGGGWLQQLEAEARREGSQPVVAR